MGAPMPRFASPPIQSSRGWSKRILSGFMLTWGRYLVGIVFAFVQLPILYRYLPAEEVGVYLLFFSFATFQGLADFGLIASFGRKISYQLGRKSRANALMERGESNTSEGNAFSDLYTSALASYLLMTLVFLAFVFILGRVYLSRLGLPSDLFRSAITAWPVFLIGVAIQMNASIPTACLSGLGDVGWDQGIRAIVNLGWLLALVVVVPTFRDIRALSILYLIQALMFYLVAFAVLRWKHGNSFSLRGSVRRELVQGLYVNGFPMFVTQLGALFIYQSAPIIVGSLLGASAVPDYVALRQLIWTTLMIATTVSATVMPFASMSYAGSDMGLVRVLHSLTVRFSMVIAGLPFVVLLVWTPDIMQLWLGSDHFVGYGVLIPLLVTALLEVQHVANSQFAWSAGYWPFAKWALFGGILSLVLSIAGGMLFGLVGIAMGLMVAQLLTNNWAGVYFSIRRIGVGLSAYARQIARPILLYMVLLTCLALLFREILLRVDIPGSTVKGLPAANVFALSVSLLLLGLSAFAIAVLFVFRRSELAMLIQSFRRHRQIEG